MKIPSPLVPYTGQPPGEIPVSQPAADGTKALPPNASIPAVPRSVSSLLVSLGLPLDRLSALVVSFTRFFSLPLEPSALSGIRRQALNAAALENSGLSSSRAGERFLASSEPAATLGEALVLAAAAAADKNALLSPAALAGYACAIDPDRRGKGQKNGEQGRDSKKQDGKADSERRDAPLGTVSPALLKEKLLSYAEQNPALNILNGLPGRNGQRWLAIPFDFIHKGREYRISLRVLLDAAAGETGKGQMCLDVVQSGTGGRRLFVMDSSGAGANARLRLLLWPARKPGALKRLRGALAAVMGLPKEYVSVCNFAGYCGLTGEQPESLLPSINEAV
ncbi:MAG: hypothetical protein LBD18_02425 [Treponema sp.]|nr:hypothetical protein [Treponema sp.]